MKGWQYRWFILSRDTGVLAYFMPDDTKRQRPRGAAKLSGAVISPSDEDSQTFSVNFATGDTFKLRAVDAKERQHWVNQLRAITQQHTQPLGQQKILHHPDQIDGVVEAPSDLFSLNNEIMMFPSANCANNAISEAKSIILQTELSHEALALYIESLPGNGSLTSYDNDLLLMKATSRATVSCLEQCLIIISRGSANASDKNRSASILSASSGRRASTAGSCASVHSTVTSTIPPPVADEEELTDTEVPRGNEYGSSTEDNKNVILYSLSQLKLGMDLTKVTLPTFILEPYSLLEMYSDFMDHPDSFVEIVDHPTPQERMIATLKWYLTAFHLGRPNCVTARKPYNPILGETFRCSWPVGGRKVRFVAEQVSHHPPTTAFYMECADKQLYLNARLSTRSKFMGMSIGINMVGEVVLCDLKHGEEYIITVPSVYARSILSVPWVEFGGKVTVTSNSGCISTCIFHAKPFYGGKLHRVTAEVKTSSGDILCKVNGEWNGCLEFALNDGTASTVDTTNLVKTKKRVQKFENQSTLDSRNVWQHVTNALRAGDVAKAAQCKQEVRLHLHM